jgi:peptidoglycan-associated lipoprotein
MIDNRRLTLPIYDQGAHNGARLLGAGQILPDLRKNFPMTRPMALTNVSLFARLAPRLIMATFFALFMAACASTTPDELPLSQQAAPPGSTQDFTVNVGDRVFFETDSTVLTAEGRLTLDRQAVWLAQYAQYAIQIEGHADERGTREYNLALGARRAATTRDYLISRGVSPTRLSTVSYGKERPVATCNDITCWSQNRRAVTALQGG